MRNGSSVVKAGRPDVDPGAGIDDQPAVLCGGMFDTTAAATQEGKSRRAGPEILVLAGVALLIGVATRFVTRSSLWLDEALTVNYASLPLTELSSALKHDGHPPLFYALLHGWMDLFGTSDVAVRALSGLFGLLTLPLIWILGRRKGGPILAWVAVAVVAVSPFAVRYSNETRMYALVMLLVTIGWLLIDDIVIRGKATILRFVAVALVGAALLYSHYWSLWLLSAVGLTSLWKIWRAPTKPERRPWIGIVLALVVSGILFVPWLPVMLFQSANTGTPWASPSRPTSALAWTLADNAGGRIGEQTLTAALFAIALVLGIFGVALNSTTTALDLRTRPTFRGAAWIASLTFLIGSATSYVTNSAYAGRYSSVIFPFMAVIVAAGITCFSARWVRFGVVAVFCALLSVSAVWNVTFERTQMPAFVPLIAENSTPGDIVVFCPDQLGPAGTRLLSPDLVFLSYPDSGDGRFVDWVGYRERNQQSDPDAFAATVLEQAGSSHTIFVIWSDSYKTFETKCSGVIDALATKRSAQLLLAEDGSTYFEHASLYRFVPTS